MTIAAGIDVGTGRNLQVTGYTLDDTTGKKPIIDGFTATWIGTDGNVHFQRYAVWLDSKKDPIGAVQPAGADGIPPAIVTVPPAGNEATWDRARFAAAQASAERARAEAELGSLLSPRAEDIAVSRAQREAAAAALAQATAERDMARLVAPIDGTVLRIMAREGEKVPEDGAMELADLSRLQAVAEIYETDLPRVRQGAAAEVIVPGEATPFPARVAEVGWTVRRNAIAGTDPVSAIDARVVEVRLDIDPRAIPALARRTNMQVQVRIGTAPPAS